MLSKIDLFFSSLRQIAYRLAFVLFLVGSADYPEYSHYLMCISFGLASISDSIVTSSRSSTHRKVIFFIYALMVVLDLVDAFSWLRLSQRMLILTLICLADSLLCIGISLISTRIPEQDYLTHVPKITCYVAFFILSIAFVLYGCVDAPFKSILSIAFFVLSILLLVLSFFLINAQNGKRQRDFFSEK